MFVAGFAAFVEARGYEFRLDRYALMQNIYAPGADTPALILSSTNLRCRLA